MYLNVDDVMLKKKLEVEDCLKVRKPELVCLTETKLSKGNDFEINNSCLVKRQRGREVGSKDYGTIRCEGNESEIWIKEGRGDESYTERKNGNNIKGWRYMFSLKPGNGHTMHMKNCQVPQWKA